MADALPTKEDLIEITNVATRGEAMQHAAIALEDIFKKARVLNQFKDLIGKFHAHADHLLAEEFIQGNKFA